MMGKPSRLVLVVGADGQHRKAMGSAIPSLRKENTSTICDGMG
jgi:hypothetical protein